MCVSQYALLQTLSGGVPDESHQQKWHEDPTEANTHLIYTHKHIHHDGWSANSQSRSLDARMLFIEISLS